MPINKTYQEIINRRKNFSHKAPTQLAKTKPADMTEDIDENSIIIHSCRLTGAIADVGWGYSGCWLQKAGEKANGFSLRSII